MMFPSRSKNPRCAQKTTVITTVITSYVQQIQHLTNNELHATHLHNVTYVLFYKVSQII